MRISYLSPKKNIKTFSFRNMKPVLIFTAEKNKEKDNLLNTEIRKKILNEQGNKFENMEKDKDKVINGGRISPSKTKIQNGSLNKKSNSHLDFSNGKILLLFIYEFIIIIINIIII
jgi:hypothetical protein